MWKSRDRIGYWVLWFFCLLSLLALAISPLHSEQIEKSTSLQQIELPVISDTLPLSTLSNSLSSNSALDRAQSANQDIANQLAESRKRAGKLADQISAIGSAVTGITSLGKTISSGSDGDLELARLIAAESQAVKDRVRRLQNISSEGTSNN